MITTNLFAAACQKVDPSFLRFPTWYAYLPKDNVNGQCTPKLESLSNIWLILAAVIGILLRVAAVMAVMFVIYGGFQYVASQGNPDSTTKARTTIVNALIGLLLAVSAAAIVQFVAGRFH